MIKIMFFVILIVEFSRIILTNMLFLFLPDHTKYELYEDFRSELDIRTKLFEKFTPETIVSIEDENGNILDECELKDLFDEKPEEL